MNFDYALRIFETYNLWLLIIGIGILATAVLPAILSRQPLSMPIVLLLLGFLAVALPLGLEAPDPLSQGKIAEHLTELGIIIALTGAGLKIDRPFTYKGWGVTGRLLGITMILSIVLTAFVGFTIAAFVPATALLLGAVMAPTDPVLASDVQVSEPGINASPYEEKDEVKFALTSEAGLNDGLAFPFTNMAIAMALAGAASFNWIETWLVIDLFYKLIVGFIVGYGSGYLLAYFIFRFHAETELAKSMLGIGALASTLIIYGAAEYLGGYGFIAAFVGAYKIRDYEREHEFHISLHQMTEKMERLFIAVILIAFGGAIAGGLLAPLTIPLIICAILIVFIVRPLTGVIALIGFNKIPWRERFAISFFGIRGIGSIYYLSFALNETNFEGAKEIWALVSLVIVISILVHGILASPVINKLKKLREQKEVLPSSKIPGNS